MKNLAETTSWLVGIPSETGAEEAIRDAIADRLDGLPQEKIATSLVVGNTDPGAVLLVGHIDTVPLQGRDGAEDDGERIHGLGATDMKSGVAVMIHLIEALGPGTVGCIFYAGEEGPLAGNQLMSVLATQVGLRAAEAAIVLEPTDREVQAGCNGALNVTVGFDGVAAHSARPWLGENAITKSGDLLSHLHQIEPDEHLIDGLSFKEVISVTRAGGGVANNIVPSRFELNLNYRFAPDRSLQSAVEYLRELCASADSFEVADAAEPGLVDLDHPLFRALIETSGAPVTGKQGWTDVAQLSQAGIPAVNFGPGETSLAHKPGESVRIEDMTWVYESLLGVLG